MMKKLALQRYHVWTFLLALFALVGLVWAQSSSTTSSQSSSTTCSPTTAAPCSSIPTFGLNDVRGRFISAETAEDVSTEHDAGNGNVGPPIFFAATAVMLADGNGNVCGQSDGFYGGTPPPGVNLGPATFHGTYTVDPPTGRIVITTCSDSGPFCGVSNVASPCDTTGKAVFKAQLGYIQSHGARRITTTEQINASDASQGGCCAVTGFLVHPRVWTRRPHDQDFEGPEN
jgi:hypothetical protein